MTRPPATAPAPRHTPLHAVHRELEAVFTDFGGWDMPLRYGSDLAEHRAVRTSAGLFDLSHMGEVKVEGPGAAAALDHALVGRISAVAVGRARYSMMVTRSGGIIDDLIVYHVGEEEFLVVPNASNREHVAAELAARCTGFEAVVTDISLETALLAVQGPRAEEILRGVVESGAGMPAALRPAADGADNGDCGPDVLCGEGILARLRYYAAVRATAAGHNILLARTGYTGEDGFELFCGAEDAEDLWRVVTESAEALETLEAVQVRGGADDDEGPDEGQAVLTPCGLAARDSLRLEAGMPLYGHELLQTITPFDASLGAVVALDKPDFVGREALEARSRRQGEEDTQVLVALAGRGRRAARAGCTVLDGSGRQLGAITSGLLSPTLGHPIALALLAPYSAQEPAWPVGTELIVEVRGRQMPMGVVATPFYKRPR